MKHKTQKAVVATVRYAGFEFPGLKLPNGDYAIGIPQIVDLLEQDNIRDYINANSDDLSVNYQKFIYNNASDRLNKIVFGRSAKKLRESWKCTELRDAMTFEELMIVDSVERLAVTLIDDQGFEPLTAVKEAGTRLLIKQIER